MKVLIVGAGPTGLTLAVELARRGVIADIVDKRDQASGFSRAVGILPKSLELLEPSGVTQSLLGEAIKIDTVKIFDDAEFLSEVKVQPSHIKFGYDKILGLAQDRTEAHIAEIFEKLGGRIKYSHELVDLTQNKDGVSVNFVDGTSTNYDYLVGADGVGSTVRTALDLKYDGYELPERWSIADVFSASWPNKKSFTISLKNQGEVAIIVPLEENRFRIISNTEDALATLQIPIQIDKIVRQGSFKISIRQVERYQKGRVFLAGDAAHCHSPVGGRGMNLGIADACDLAKRFVEGGLEGYSDARHSEGASVIAVSERGRKFITSKSPIIRKTQLLFIKLFLRFKFVQRRLSNVALYGGQS